jgi:Mrp family chromosome partitioning ATPase
VTDAAVLGTIVDGVILVVHAGKTRAGIVQRGLEQMRYISAPIEGVILNNLQVKSRYYPGYYNYYYYYSYYGAGKARGRKAPRKPASESASTKKMSAGGDPPSA